MSLPRNLDDWYTFSPFFWENSLRTFLFDRKANRTKCFKTESRVSEGWSDNWISQIENATRNFWIPIYERILFYSIHSPSCHTLSKSHWHHERNLGINCCFRHSHEGLKRRSSKNSFSLSVFASFKKRRRLQRSILFCAIPY